MNPQGYPSAPVPLKGVPYGQPEGPGMVQHTTVNIIVDHPKDHIIWSIFNFIHMNPCCLGLAALIHSIKVSSCYQSKVWTHLLIQCSYTDRIELVGKDNSSSRRLFQQFS
uniref:Uncharacterized protein n=1 Tax=Acanthochromis polyacanthus TaxID=80966 RepID=A0A3Q1FF45_9TELE